MTTLSERIKEIARYYNVLKPFEFSRKTGFNHQTSSNYLKGRPPTSQNLCIIQQTFDNINPDWLLTGRGEMFRRQEDVPLASPTRVKEGIPLIPTDAMAGVSRGELNVLDIDCETFIVPSFEGVDYLITMKGSSMCPKYNSGDIVACKKVAIQDIFFQWNKVYVLDTNQGILIKRIEEHPDDQYIICISENKAYKPFPLQKDKIEAIAIVMGVIRLE